MIHNVSCKNFYSFGEDTSLDFVVNDNAPKSNGYFTTPSGARLSKAEVVIGPNASGKTNLLKILPIFKWLIIDSYNLNPQAPISVRPFMFDGYKDKPIELSVVFEIEGNVYTYNFSLDQTKILSEKLTLTSLAKEKKSSKQMFERTWNKESNKYDFNGENFNFPKGFENLLRSNTSIIAVAIRLNHKESQDIANFWQKLETNVSEAGWIGDHLFLSHPSHLWEALDFFSGNEVLKKEAEKLLSRFDLGLDVLEIKKEKKENNSFSVNVRVSHSFGDKKEFLPLNYESSGTKQLFVLLKHILKTLAQGGIVILDEIDMSLHPEMVIALFDLFIEPTTNQHNAQIVVSTHNHLILSKLDKYQIVLVEKNKSGISEAWRLDEMEGVRADENYYSKYITGAYGAVPKIQ